MSSEIKIGQYLECCIDLPSINGSAESPVFFWKGNEWLFRSVVKYTTSWSGKWDFEVYLDLKKKHTDLEPCQVKCQIGMKKEEILRSYKFQVSPHYLIWSISLEDLQKKLSSSSQDGNTLNILLFFDGETKPLLKLSKEIGE